MIKYNLVINMIYKTNFMGKTFESIFIYEDYLGSYLICKSMPYDVRIPKMVSMNVSGEFIDINVSDNNDYYTKKIRLNGECVYIFYKEKKDENITYLSLSELDLKNTFIDYKMVLYYLSKIAKLPNGNFIVGNVEDYIMAITELNIKYKDKEPFYRGHYSYTYELTPSLYRNKNYFENESFMYMDFKTQFYNELRNKKYIEILTTMQHYKLPTRMLDTTSNPLVALFMACDRPINYHDRDIEMGEVIYMGESKENIKYSDSNAVTLISSLSVLETRYKQELYESIMKYKKTGDSSIYKNTMAYKRFVAEVKNELPSFNEELFDPETLIRHRHVKVGMINERVIAQSASFILFGLCNYNTGEYMPLQTQCKERIFVVNREFIRKQLNMLNINSSTMYPDMDHKAMEIVKSYEE